MKLLCVVLLLLGCLTVYSLGDTELVCGPVRKVKIWRQWTRAYGQGRQRLEFSIRFWKKFFKEDPKVRQLYNRYGSDNVYSPKFLAFTQRLFASFAAQLELVDDVNTNMAILKNAKADYDELNIPLEAYEMYDEIVIDTLTEYLGRHTDLDAWKACLHHFNLQFKSFYESSQTVL